MNRYASTLKSGQVIDPSDIINVRNVSNAHTSEYVYYECQQINLTDTVQDCEYQETRNVPIVMKPSDYKFSVQRIEASLVDVEMFNSDDRELIVTNQFIADNITVSIPVLLGTNVEIYNINQVIPAINAALSSAFVGVKTAYDIIYGPGAWDANAALPQQPFGVQYDEVEDRLTVYAPLLSASNYPQGIRLSFNDEMVELFRGNTYDVNILDRLYFDAGFGNVNVVTLNGNQYIVNRASYATSAMWYSVKQVVLLSERLGARLVKIGVPGNLGNVVSRSIILDFNYVIDNELNAPGTRLQYLTNNNRWTDLMKDTPLNEIDFKLFYRNKNERLVPIKLRPGESFSILCCFAKTLTT